MAPGLGLFASVVRSLCTSGYSPRWCFSQEMERRSAAPITKMPVRDAGPMNNVDTNEESRCRATKTHRLPGKLSHKKRLTCPRLGPQPISQAGQEGILQSPPLTAAGYNIRRERCRWCCFFHAQAVVLGAGRTTKSSFKRGKTGASGLATTLRRCRDEIPKHLKVPNPSKLRVALRQFALKGALAGLLSARWLAQQEIAHGMKCSRSFCSLLARFSSSR